MFSCRFLVKPPDEKDETMEEKQQRVFKYETMYITSALLPNTNDHLESGDVSSESSDIGPCILCVARRMAQNDKSMNTPVQQFTVKLDSTGRITAVDTSWLSSCYCQYLNKVKIISSPTKFVALSLSSKLVPSFDHSSFLTLDEKLIWFTC